MPVAQVYDATPFLRDHPGGGDSILIVAGTDATEEFNAIHSDKAKAQLLEYCIGELADENVPRARPHAVLGPWFATAVLLVATLYVFPSMLILRGRKGGKCALAFGLRWLPLLVVIYFKFAVTFCMPIYRIEKVLH